MKSINKILVIAICTALTYSNISNAGDGAVAYSSETKPVENTEPNFGPDQDFITWPWTERKQYLWYVKNQNWEKRLGFTAHYYQAKPDAHKDCIRNGREAGWFMSHDRCNGSTGGLAKREMSRAFPDHPSCDTRFIYVTANYCD